MHFWLHHTAHCAETIVSAHWYTGSVSAERVGQGEVGGVTHRVTYTWWLLGLAVKTPWLGPCGPILSLAAWTGLENATLTFLAGKAAWTLSGCLTTESADCICMFVNEWAWLKSRVCLLKLKMSLGSVLELELRQIWRYSALRLR